MGIDATFRLERCQFDARSAACVVIKDAGDDPDVTHLAEVAALVTFRDPPGLELAGGVGVGVVTRPGLGLEVGGPAINPVPRRMIGEHVRAAAGDTLAEQGLRVEIAMPRGEELARRTLNGRLGHRRRPIHPRHERGGDPVLHGGLAGERRAGRRRGGGETASAIWC